MSVRTIALLGTTAAVAAFAMILEASSVHAQKPELVYAKDGSGIPGYKDTPIQPWSGYHVHDPDRPAPKQVDPGPPSKLEKPITAPSGAIVLFDGKDMSQWRAAEWTVEEGCLVAGRGNLVTKEEFGDCQLHLEWQAPDPPRGSMWDRGNSGVHLLGMFEIQIFDSYTTKIYPDGQAAAIYAQTPPLVNAVRKPGEWQTYDIVLLAPAFQDGKLIEPARVTMFHNGLLVHLNQEIYGHSPHRGLASYANASPTGPVALMAHNNPVRFRDIWIRPLAPRAQAER